MASSLRSRVAGLGTEFTLSFAERLFKSLVPLVFADWFNLQT